MTVLVFAVCLTASVIGGICGIGGGVIIKPTLDAMNLMSVSSVSFLSGLTVLSMAVINVIRSRSYQPLDFKIGSFLAVGAVGGGFLGSMLFQRAESSLGDDRAGMMQSILLGIVTLLTLLYSKWLRKKLPSYHVKHPAACILIGMAMGVISAFLGIGGGPINLAALFFAFSMETKKAAAYSLYIIMVSQIASLVTTIATSTVPSVPWTYLVTMVLAGVTGGIIGSKVNKKISPQHTDSLFAGLLCVIILICIYNAKKFAA